MESEITHLTAGVLLVVVCVGGGGATPINKREGVLRYFFCIPQIATMYKCHFKTK